MNSAWRNPVLFAALVLLGGMYVLAFVFFRAESHDFIAMRQNHAALERAARRTIEAPATLKLVAGSADAMLLGNGWYEASPHGTWSSMRDSWIALGLRPADTGVAVTLNAIAFVARHHKRVVISADVDGNLLGKWLRDQGNSAEALAFCIPPQLARKGNPLLHLQVEPIASPLQANAGPDSRRLGLLLSSIDLHAGCERKSQQ